MNITKRTQIKIQISNNFKTQKIQKSTRISPLTKWKTTPVKIKQIISTKKQKILVLLKINKEVLKG